MDGNSDKYLIKSRTWLEGKRGPFLGEGKIQLLEAIAEFGSISEAAKSMEMSYKKAWKLVDGMNKESRKPLVIRSSGGKGGGGTILTTNGKDAIKKFKKFNERLKRFLDKESAKLRF